MIKNVLKSDF